MPSVGPMSNQPSQSAVTAVMEYVTPSESSSSVADAVMPTCVVFTAFSATVFDAGSMSEVPPIEDSLTSATVTEYCTVCPVLVPSDIVTYTW